MKEWERSFSIKQTHSIFTETKFSDATVLLCDVHRNRAWDRWTKTKENVHDHGKEIMSWFMRLGQASNEKKFYCTLEEFRASIFWTDRVRNYMEKIWLPQKKVFYIKIFFEMVNWDYKHLKWKISLNE